MPRWWFTNRNLQSTITGSSTALATSDAGPITYDGPQAGPSPQDPQSIDAGFYEVVMQGANPYTLTNGMVLSGTVTVPVELGEIYGAPVSVSLQDYGEPIPSTAHEAPFARPVPALLLDTTRLTNGVHNISTYALFTDETYGYPIDAEETSPEVSIIVSNVVSYPYWAPYFGDTADQLLFTAQVACSNITWRLDIYDSQTNYVGTLTNSSPDGSIYVVWDLRDPNGILHTDSTFNFNLTAYSGGVPFSVSKPPPLYKLVDPWPGGFGGWVVVNQLAFPTLVGNEAYQTMADGVAEIPIGLGLANRPGGAGGSFPLRFAEGGANTYSEETNDWGNFRLALYHPGSRNLYYFGHGGPNGLGYNQADPAISISHADIATNVAPYAAYGTTNYHHYRFVFLDGCQTGSGPLSKAFGIPNEQHVANWWLDAGLRPNFFAGWKQEKFIGTWGGTVFYDHIHFVQHWVAEWGGGIGVAQAFNNASGYPDDQYVNYGNMKKNGYWDLAINGYNQ